MKRSRLTLGAIAALALGCGSSGSGLGFQAAEDAGVGGSSGQGGSVALGGTAGSFVGAGGSVELGGAAGSGGGAGAGGSAGQGAGGGGSVPGSAASMVAISGNGAALLENWPGGALGVRVVDASGAPLANQVVTWSVLSGEGAGITSPSQPTGVTDASGVASRTIMGAFFQPSQPFGKTIFRATSPAGSIDFVTVTVHIGTIGPVGAYMSFQPTSSDLGKVKAGSVVPGAAQLVAAVQAGTFSGTPLPHVGLRFVNPADASAEPAAQCSGGVALSNAKGVAVCDLVIGNQLGPQSIAPLGGESVKFSSITLEVVP